MSPLIRKLEHGEELSPADRALLEDLLTEVSELPPHADLIAEGQVPGQVYVLLEGFACRYKTLPDGSREILAWLTPGDLCDLHVSVLDEMDHSITTLARSKVGHLPRNALEQAVVDRPRLLRALWWATLVDAAVLREWLVNLGRRAGDQRVAHLFCELLARLQAVGLADDEVIDFPLTQSELADSAGLSTVHVNRIVQHLREAGLIAWRAGKLRVLDRPGLEALAGFNPAYLHLRRRPA